MHAWLRPRLGAVAAALLVLGLTCGLRAAEPASDRAVLDKQIADALKDVHNRGADMFNMKDHVGCYRVFQGLLWTVRPLLASHPDLQKQIDEGMDSAERLPSIDEKARALHALIESVRRGLLPAGKPQEKKPEKITEKKPEEKKPEKPASTLWERLGGEPNVKQVVDTFVDNALVDPRVNFDGNGKRKLTRAEIEHLKSTLVGFVSQATGGPLKYSGKTMKEAHKGMGITDAEFDAAKANLKYALETHGAAPADAKAVLDAVEGTRKDIVENKPPEKKSEDKKPPDKKTDEKKPEKKPDGEDK
jgi:hemoglobin